MSSKEFTKHYSNLNDKQRQAVDHIDGPILVIAGPGTGKTELLTIRVANILLKSDTQPENILCLTFTESAAYEMRQRLVNIVGQQAYNITISTYHAFGRELIARFPDYFNDNGDMHAIDELGQHNVIEAILSDLPYTNPLKRSSYYVRDVISAISDCKRALLEPKDLIEVAKANLNFIEKASDITKVALSGVARINKSSIAAFEALAKETSKLDGKKSHAVSSLQQMWQSSLEEALETVKEADKTTPLTAWKNAWLTRDKNANFIAAGKFVNEKLIALAEIYEKYLVALNSQSAFDYDDMILRAIRGLLAHEELRYSLQEQYLYMLLDEFQDTNAAQFELVKLLSDSPLHEGRPNILAVGDDDQAIYAFQGADYSHMLAIKKHYKDVAVITLTQNYRSHSDVLHVAHNIAGQIEQRLHHHLEGIEKIIQAESTTLPKDSTIERHEFKSDVAQYGWVAEKIASLIAEGTEPQEIAILAPKHKYLEPIIPYLRQSKIPVRYDKRENVLEDTNIKQLVRMSELVIAISKQDLSYADSLWPEVLSYDFWELPTEKIWELSWQAHDTKTSWTKLLIKEEWGKQIGLFFVQLSNLVSIETLETMLDYLIGVKTIGTKDQKYQSPFYEYNFGKDKQSEDVASFWSLLSNLTVLRQNLREYRLGDSVLTLQDFIDFVHQHIAADIKILNTSPYHESTDAVQVMTAYKSKGLEFEHVFVLASLDDVWGSKAKTQSARVPLPPNLNFVRYQGADDDERLRLLFVAITRAKHGLYFTSYETNYANRPTSRLKFLNETESNGMVTSSLLPKDKQAVIKNDYSTPLVNDLVSYWQSKHSEPNKLASLQSILKPRLDRFQLAPTHLNSFIDTVYSGPEYFFINTILRFPKAPSVDGEYGNVIHAVLEWIHIEHKRTHKLPSKAAIIKTFYEKLDDKQITKRDKEQLKSRGEHALDAYIAQKLQTFNITDEHEYNFRNQGIFVGDAHLSGKIDKMIINKMDRTITVVDYKTGESFKKWDKNIKLHKYKQQLYMYKLLVEGSNQFADYKVTDAYLEFVEPDSEGEIIELRLSFDNDELLRLKKLIIATWKHIKGLDFPDISNYSSDLSGTIQFEEDLIKETI